MDQFELNRVKVLVVDDNKHMLNLLKTMLHACSVREMRLSADPAEAFRELRGFSADLVITDWNMEPLDGLEFARLLRTGSDSPDKQIPIIMLTGQPDVARVLEAKGAGVDGFLAKPVSIKTLRERMVTVLLAKKPDLIKPIPKNTHKN